MLRSRKTRACSNHGTRCVRFIIGNSGDNACYARRSRCVVIQFCYRDDGDHALGESTTMRSSAALLALGLVAACCPAMARSHHGHAVHRSDVHHYAARTVHHHASLAHRTHAGIHIAQHADVAPHVAASSGSISHSAITCEMVRAYVAQVGLAQAAAMAQSAGITASEKDRARRCLEQKS